MKIKTTLYRFTTKVLSILPFNLILFKIIRKNRWLSKKIYLDLKFSAIFDVKINNSSKFKLKHFGGRIESETFWFGLFNTFEKESGWLWIKLSENARVIFDIGANTGIYSLVTKSINKTSIIHAFEPSKNTYNKLLENNKINNYNIICNEIALSNTDGFSAFFDSFDSNQTSASMSIEMSNNWTDYQINKYSVQTMTYKNYINKNKINLEEIDLIKIDVEMFEPEVMEGFEEVLFNLTAFVFIEVLNDEVADKLNVIFNNKFTFYHLQENETLLKRKSLQVVPLKWNYLACPNNLVQNFEDRFMYHLQK